MRPSTANGTSSTALLLRRRPCSRQRRPRLYREPDRGRGRVPPPTPRDPRRRQRRPRGPRDVHGSGRVLSVSPSRHRSGRPRPERRELADDPAAEREELARIYVDRGLDHAAGPAVAEQLMPRRARLPCPDELAISEVTTARPVQAALTSAATLLGRRGTTFGDGGALARQTRGLHRVRGSLVFLAVLGALGAKQGAHPSPGPPRGDLLGRAGHGRHGGHREPGRQSRLTTAADRGNASSEVRSRNRASSLVGRQNHCSRAGLEHEPEQCGGQQSAGST